MSTTAVPVKLHCPKCGRRYQTKGVSAGRSLKCPQCGTPLVAASPAGGAGKPAVEPAAKAPRSWLPAAAFIIGTVVLGEIVWVVAGAVNGVALMLVVLTTVLGFRAGAIRLAGAFVAMVIAFLLAAPLGRLFEGATAAVLGLGGMVNRLASMVIVGLVLTAGIGAGLSVVGRRVSRRYPGALRWDRWAGAALGGVEGVLLVLALAWGTFTLEPIVLAQAAAGQGRTEAGGMVLRSAAALRDSSWGTSADAMNPLAEARAMRTISKLQLVLSRRDTGEAFCQHPLVQEFCRRPAVEQALTRLSAELESAGIDDGPGRKSLLRLASSPRVLAILDETGVLRDWQQYASDLEPAMDEVLKAKQVRFDEPATGRPG